MPNNPLTEQELYDYGILRSLTPSAEVVGRLSPPYFPAGYFLVPPHDVNGPVLWRKFNAGYISEGIIDPNRLGTGVVGDGNLYLADDGTWKAVSSGGGSQNLQQVTDLGNVTTNTIDTAGTKSDYFLLDTLATPTLQPGMFGWNEAEGTADLRLNDGTTLQLGQEQHWYVKNSSGSSIPDGTVVMAVGTDGTSGHILVAPMVADGSVEERYLLGITTNAIANGSFGHVTTFGKVRGLDLSMFQEGDVLYCDPANPGGLTATQPIAPNLDIPIAFVINNNQNNGTLAVRVLPGYHLGELHDVYTNSPSTGQLLRYNTNRWENWTPNFLTTVPTLDQVTTAGNTTTNDITVGGLTVDTDLIYTDTVNNRVGINTSSPLYSFHAVGSNFRFGRGASVDFDIANTGNGRYLRLTASTTDSVIQNLGSNDIGFNNNFNRVMTLKSTGNVLIGTTTDAGYKLDVVGADSRFNGVRVGLGTGVVSTNTVVGNSALNANTSGSNTTAIGYRALQANTTGNNNTAIGYGTLLSNTTGANNTAVGIDALGANTTAFNNVAFGRAALRANTTGFGNSAFGTYSLEINTTGIRNVAVGQSALRFGNGSYNVAVGVESLYNNSTGTTNIAIGDSSLYSSTIATNNVAIGGAALYFNVLGNGNVAVGRLALQDNTSSNNTAVGFEALADNTTGTNNTAIGYQAGNSGVPNTTGTNNIFIGYQSTGISATESNRTWIGNNSTASTWVGGNLLVGTTTNAGYKLDVNGSVRFGGSYKLTYDGLNGASLDHNGAYLNVGAGNTKIRAFAGSVIDFISNNNSLMRLYPSVNNCLFVGASSNPTETLEVGGAKGTMKVNGNAYFISNVGIGTTSPSTVFHVDTSSAAPAVRLSDFYYDYFIGYGSVGATKNNNYWQIYRNASQTYYDQTSGGHYFVSKVGGTRVDLLRILQNGNVLIGTTTDAGERLQVAGDVRITNGRYKLGGSQVGLYATTDLGLTVNTGSGNSFLGYYATGDTSYLGTTVTLGRLSSLNLNATSGLQEMVRITGNYAPTSGTGLFTALQLSNTINQTGGANGITRGLYVNPTLTSAADFRAIETTAGKIIHQGLTNATHTSQVYYDTTTGELTYGAAVQNKNFVIDYDYNIIGVKDGINTNFSTTSNFITGTTRVYLNGQRLTPGAEYDYVELSSNQISLFYAPVPSDRLIIEYETT